MKWTKLTNIPDQIGFAGAYVGTSHDCLVVMGGANFLDNIAPWDGGKKVWTNKIFVLKEKDGKWIELGNLPCTMGYGATASYKDNIFIAGGSNENGHIDHTYKLSFQQNRLQIEQLPNLPHQIANCSSVLIGKHWYILGGIKCSDSKTALSICWRLDLEQTENGWKQCPSIPGEGRMLSVAGNLNGDLILVSGVSLHDGKRKYLRDAYILNAENIWTQIRDLPKPVVAAPNPAWFDRHSSNLLIFGGDNGELASKNLKEKHPGFSSDVLCYNPNENIWKYLIEKIEITSQNQGDKLWTPVTTGAVFWKGGVVLPMGEIKPGVRTSQVLMGTFITREQE